MQAEKALPQDQHRAARADEERAAPVERAEELGTVGERDVAHEAPPREAEAADRIRAVEVERQLRARRDVDLQRLR